MSAILRKEQHQLARHQMLGGDYFNALKIMQSARHQYGPHVGLLSDLIAVLYALGRVEECNKMTLQLKSELENNRRLLSKDSAAKTYLFIGKIFEEQGQVAEAIESYSEAAELATENFEVRLRAQAQLLRLLSFLGRRANLPELYQFCVKAQIESKNLLIEVEHALMLSEIILFGVHHAEARLQRLMTSESLSLADCHLLIADFSEEVLRQGLDLSSVKSYSEQISPKEADEFEKIIFFMVQSPSFELGLSDLQKLMGRLPTLGLLRTLILNLKRSHDSHIVNESKRNFLFHLEGVSYESKAMLLRKWQNELSDSAVILTYNPDRSELSFNDRSTMIKAGSFAAKSISSFIGRSSIPIDEFIKQVFESSWDPSYYDRIRIALMRLNKDLSLLTGFPKTFIAKKDCIEIHTGYVIKMKGH